MLDAARSRCARDGYDATTIRGVAADAGVDPAVIIQFYGSESGLFAATLADLASAVELMLAILSGPRKGIGERFTRAYLQLWEDPIAGKKVQSMVRAIIGSPRATAMYRAQLRHVVTKSGIPAAAQLRRLLGMTHLFGTAIGHHILEIPALDTPSVNQLVRELAPAVDRYLRAD